MVGLNGATIGRFPWTPQLQEHAAVVADHADSGARRAPCASSGRRARLRLGLGGRLLRLRARCAADRGRPRGARPSSPICAASGRRAAARRRRPGARRLLRTAPIVHPQGVLKPLMLLTRFGVSGPIGRGTQKWPWISLDDEVRGIRHVIDTRHRRPVNLTGPTPATANDLGFALAVRMNRPFVLRAPVWALKPFSVRCDRGAAHVRRRGAAGVLEASGFTFRHPTVEPAPWMPRLLRSGLSPPLGGSRAGSRGARPHAPACGRLRRRTPARAGTRPASRPGGPRRRRGTSGKTASPSSRTTRPLGRTVTDSSGRPPSASSRRASCSARTPNHSSRPSAQAAMTGSTTRATPIAMAIGSPLISRSHAR